VSSPAIGAGFLDSRPSGSLGTRPGPSPRPAEGSRPECERPTACALEARRQTAPPQLPRATQVSRVQRAKRHHFIGETRCRTGSHPAVIEPTAHAHVGRVQTRPDCPIGGMRGHVGVRSAHCVKGILDSRPCCHSLSSDQRLRDRQQPRRWRLRLQPVRSLGRARKRFRRGCRRQRAARGPGRRRRLAGGCVRLDSDPPGPFNPPFVQAQPVPTEVTRGSDGALYVSLLSGVPFLPGTAGIYRVVLGQAPRQDGAPSRPPRCRVGRIRR